jgi:DNA-binding transcriptional LysR family regulator
LLCPDIPRTPYLRKFQSKTRLDAKSGIRYLIRTMRVGLLRVFYNVAVTGSFSEAARLHRCTQANISTLFRGLEQTFGVQLAVRTTRRFQLTPAGVACHEASREIVQYADELEKRMRHLKNSGAQTIELAATYCIRLHQLPPLLAEFQRAHPTIQVSVRQGRGTDVYSDVIGNVVDVGLVPYPKRQRGFNTEIFHRDPLVLVCPPGHPLAGAVNVNVPALRDWPIVRWKEIPWSPLLKNIRPRDRHLFEPRHEFPFVETAVAAVQQNLGIAVLPSATVRESVADGTLAAVPFEGGRHTQPLGVLWRQRRKLPPALRTFLEFLKRPL